jgi:hypothetical protein
MAQLDTLVRLQKAFGTAFTQRGNWILKQREIAKAKVIVEQLSISDRVFSSCAAKLQQYLTDYGAATQRFSEAYSKLGEEGSKRADEALEFAKNSSPGIRDLVLQDATLEMSATKTLFKVLGTVQDGLIVIHEQNIRSLVVLLQVDASPQRTAFFEELKKGAVDKFFGLIPGVDWLMIAYRAVEAAVLAQIKQGESANNFLASIEKFNEGGFRWLEGVDAHSNALKQFNPFAKL